MPDFPPGHVWYYAVWLPALSVAHVHAVHQNPCLVLPEEYRETIDWGLGIVMQIQTHVCIKCRRPYGMVVFEECVADSNPAFLRGGKSDRKLRGIPEASKSAAGIAAQQGDLDASAAVERIEQGLPVAPLPRPPSLGRADGDIDAAVLAGLGHEWVYELWLPAPSPAHARIAHQTPFVTLPDDYEGTPGWDDDRDELAVMEIDVVAIRCRTCGVFYPPDSGTAEPCTSKPGKRHLAPPALPREDIALMQASRISGLS
ncbi:hypothetical protein ACIHFD_49470 [Nonomuraea sp. NPDC051941]|uniref:hypothetical protein n=1 Tax=Nonomuraea sp. NPDC051941 TaxID=3364373 RepID=UPI0037C754D1